MTERQEGSTSQFDHTRKPHKRHDSKTSVSTTQSAQSQHQEYISRLQPPTFKSMERIAAIQDRKEEEIMRKRLSIDRNGTVNDAERMNAASLIQRNYRGHRERRQLQGLSLDPTTRWIEAIKEARYRDLTTPRPRSNTNDLPDSEAKQKSIAARKSWKKVGLITRRAGGDEERESNSSDDENEEGLSEEQKNERRKLKMEQKASRRKTAKTMDLQYFLEVVDVRHRYGSNLRTYHEQWKKADTNENFFYWLDYGEGKDLEMAGCPRDRLERECVRYLSKEERLCYLVKIDDEGCLCWARNGARIDTTEEYKDSIHGIVPKSDPTPSYEDTRNIAVESAEGPTSVNSIEHRSPLESPSSADSTHTDVHSDEEDDPAAETYTNDKLHSAPAIKKVKYVSAATIFNKLLRSSVKKNTWLFVADTSFRLYVGIKRSGAFQHSSFLHGSRISAAGTIKIKNGHLSKLSPLSGHYRPPLSNFRNFEQSLKERGVDMSHVSISRSYAVLFGLEAYVKTRRKGKKIIRHLLHGKEKLLDPEEAKRKELEEQDKSESAARERAVLEKEAERLRKEQAESLNAVKLMKKLKIGSRGSRDEENDEGYEEVHEVDEAKATSDLAEEAGNSKHDDISHEGIRDLGSGAEDGIAPEGKR